MKNAFLVLIFLFSLSLLESKAQSADFEAFIKKFPKKTLPIQCEYKPKQKFNKSLKISPLEAKTWLTSFKSPDGIDLNLYETLIEPFGPTKSPEGRLLQTKMNAEKVALLKQTDEYVLVLIRVYFLDKVMDYSEGERYFIHTFKPDSTPISVLWVAQKVQFDLHYNQISSQIDENGNIVSLVEVFAPSENTKKEEKYRITEMGEIVEVK
jgi:hypothetical protein